MSLDWEGLSTSSSWLFHLLQNFYLFNSILQISFFSKLHCNCFSLPQCPGSLSTFPKQNTLAVCKGKAVLTYSAAWIDAKWTNKSGRQPLERTEVTETEHMMPIFGGQEAIQWGMISVGEGGGSAVNAGHGRAVKPSWMKDGYCLYFTAVENRI